MERRVLLFKLNSAIFGLDIKYVEGLYPIKEYYKEKYMPKYVKGIYSFKNFLYPIVCLKEIMKVGECEEDINLKTIVLLKVENFRFSLLIDDTVKIVKNDQKKSQLETTLYKSDDIFL